jgi:L-alanine-DL-glutamate epimerase-like enolase superfamily enzyme
MTALPETAVATYQRLADLPLVIESYSLEGLSRPWSSEFTRRTTVVRLEGRGHVGVGEDVTYTPDDHDNFAGPALAGSSTLARFCRRLDELDLFARRPKRQDSYAHRQWAFESAALDLALRQNSLSLAEALGREPRPVWFVASMRLPEPASIDPVLRRLGLYPDLRFKLDVTSSWDDDLISQLAATGAVDTVDFKAHYDGLAVGGDVDPELYRRVAEGLPDAWIEDPALTPETEPVLASHASRITWDAPIHSVADVTALSTTPRIVNMKPSRFGTLEAFLETLDFLEAEGIGAYGGGQFELGPGRGQIQHLAAIFHADAPNDVAPLGYHEVQPNLLPSPLLVPADAVGFR